MNLSLAREFDFSGKKVIVRGDTDVSFKKSDFFKEKRLEVLSNSVNTILEKGAAKVIILGHMGRPKAQEEELSLQNLQEYFSKELKTDVCFVDFEPFSDFDKILEKTNSCNEKVVLLENLRFWKEEEENKDGFAKGLASLGEVFVNEAFAVSHRKHASIVGIQKYMNCVFGFHFEKEIKNLSKVFDNPARPVIVLISGFKEDKLSYVEEFKKFADKILIGGRLPLFLPEDYSAEKVFVARLNPDKEDITIHSIENFEQEVLKAKTIVLSGPVGIFEEEGHRLGTERVFTAVADSKAFRIAGGGDTLSAISVLGLEEKFDFLSLGGGAMLEFLAHGTLPALSALIH